MWWWRKTQPVVGPAPHEQDVPTATAQAAGPGNADAHAREADAAPIRIPDRVADHADKGGILQMSERDASDGDDRLEMSGPKLALRCYELNELAARVRELLKDDLQRLGAEQSVYGFAERLKGQENIQNKVLRIREETQFQAKRGAQARRFHAEDVTDAWGCRFVTLFQSQILDVLVQVLRLIEEWRRERHEVLIDSIDVYTNRPDHDPSSIAPRVAQRIKSFSLASFRSASQPFEIKHRIDSRDSGYSAVHVVLCMTLRRKVFGNDVADTVKFEVQIRDLFE